MGFVGLDWIELNFFCIGLILGDWIFGLEWIFWLGMHLFGLDWLGILDQIGLDSNGFIKILLAWLGFLGWIGLDRTFLISLEFLD